MTTQAPMSILNYLSIRQAAYLMFFFNLMKGFSMKFLFAFLLLFATVAQATNPVPTVSNITDMSASFVWTAVDTDTYFVMKQVKVGTVTTFQQVATVVGTSYVADGLTPQTAYLYRVLSYYPEYAYWSYAGALDLKFATLATTVAASVSPYQTSLISYNVTKAPCLSSYKINPVAPWASFLGCGDGLLADDPTVSTAFVTMKLRKDTIIEVRFPQAIRTFIANVCMGCSDEFNSYSTVQVSADFGVTWQFVSNYGPVHFGPVPMVLTKLGGQTQQRQSLDASVILNQATDTVWVKGYERIVDVGAKEPKKYLPNVFHVRGQ